MTEQKTSGPARLTYIDAVKGLGIILVVTGHFIEYYRGRATVFNAVFECIYLFHMALFCLCSGLLAKWNPKKLLRQQLWLYLLCQTVFLAFRLVVLQEEISFGALLGQWLLPWRHMWYLYALLFWELTLPLLRYVKKAMGLAGQASALVAVLVLCLLGGVVQWPLSFGRVVAFYPFFALGVLFGGEITAWAKLAAGSFRLRAALAAALCVFYGVKFLRGVTATGPITYEGARIFQEFSYTQGGYTPIDRAVFYLVGTLTVLALIAVAGRSHALASLGGRTLPVYLLHMPVYAFLVQMGLYATAGERPTVAVAAWAIFAVGGTVCFAASRPVCAALNAAANVWYRPRRGAKAPRTRDLQKERD